MSQLSLRQENTATVSLLVVAPQPTSPALMRPAIRGRSFADEPASPSLAPASPLLQELHPASRRRADSQSRAAARKNAVTSAGYPAATRASPGIQQGRPASDKQPFSGTTISPPSLAQASSLRRQFSPVFIMHAVLPCSSVILILTAINISYNFAWLFLQASRSHIGELDETWRLKIAHHQQRYPE
jgi:hypothetical protein